ncbi:MAG: DUF1415 domain-containing protein [Myxococcota bacterium]|nr:DUF1415 domain-containing protein [Myxococcota bacterium]
MSNAVEATRAWVESVVVELELCPFAREVLAAGRVRFIESPARDPEALLADLDSELARLLRTPVADLDTTLLVHPHTLVDFADYNDFLDPAEALLRARGCEGVVQLASFHPEYVFADSAHDDPANWTNRSPHPMLHLLREQSVTDAIAAFAGAADIPARNAERLRELGEAEMRSRRACCRSARASARCVGS